MRGMHQARFIAMAAAALAACAPETAVVGRGWHPAAPSWDGALVVEVLDAERVALRWPTARDAATPADEMRYRWSLAPVTGLAVADEARGVTAVTVGGLLASRRWQARVHPRSADGLDGAVLGPVDFELPAAVAAAAALTDAAAVVTGDTLTVTWRSRGAAAVRCTLDQLTVEPCESPWRTERLAVGPHLLSLLPLDAAGRAGPAWFALVTVTAPPAGGGGPSVPPAGRAPRLVVTAAPADPSWAQHPAVDWWVDDESAVGECRHDGGEWAACAPPLVLSGAPGRRQLELRARAADGRLSPVSSIKWLQADCARPGAWCTAVGRDASPFVFTDGPAATLALQWPGAVAAAADGRIAIADGFGGRIWLIAADGSVRRVAGDGRNLVSDPDGPDARLRAIGVPWGIVFDDRRIVFSNIRHSCLRAVDLDSGALSTVAGACGTSGMVDGAALSARFAAPRGLARTAGGAIYIADAANHRIRRLVGGVVSTIAGTGVAGFGGDGGAATSALLHFPSALALGPGDRSLYFADTSNHRVRQIDFAVAPARMATVIGNGSEESVDGVTATATGLANPQWVAFPEGGDLHAGGAWGSGAIVRLAPDGRLHVRLPAGSADGNAGDGGRFADALLRPHMAATAQGPDLLIVGRRALRAVHDDRIYTLAGAAGDQAPAPASGPALHGALQSPVAVVSDGGAVSWVLDAGAGRIVRLDAGRFAGTLGPALADPRALVLDRPRGRLYVAEAGRHRVLSVRLADGVTAVVAGTGSPGIHDGAGAAVETPLVAPWGLWHETRDLWVVDAGAHCIRRVDLDDGSIGTWAGACGQAGSSDAADLRNMRLQQPASLTGDGAGTWWVYDAANRRIRRLRASGSTTVAGNGSEGTPVAGSATASPLRALRGLAWDGRLRRLLIGQFGAVWALAVDDGLWSMTVGQGEDGRGFHSGQGSAAAARLYLTGELTADSDGTLWVPEPTAGRVMRLAGE